MPFSFTNTFITFQSYIKKALKILVDAIYVIYLNNIFIYLFKKISILNILSRYCNSSTLRAYIPNY